jgi:hypothetical protein
MYPRKLHIHAKSGRNSSHCSLHPTLRAAPLSHSSAAQKAEDNVPPTLLYSKRHLPDIEQCLPRHPEVGSSWSSWSRSSYPPLSVVLRSRAHPTSCHPRPSKPSRSHTHPRPCPFSRPDLLAQPPNPTPHTLTPLTPNSWQRFWRTVMGGRRTSARRFAKRETPYTYPGASASLNPKPRIVHPSPYTRVYASLNPEPRILHPTP